MIQSHYTMKQRGKILRDQYAAKRDQFARLSIPELIELLSSDDLKTRFLAEMCLRDATNT